MPQSKEVEISLMDVNRMGIDMKCLDVGLIRRYGVVYRTDDGHRWDFRGAYNNDARETIVFCFEENNAI